MSFNGSGVFVVNSAGQPVVATTLITAAAMNALTADLATALSTCVLKDGTQTITQNIPMNDKKITNLGAPTARTDAASLLNIQNATGVYVATVGGTVSDITLTPSPALTAYTAGQTFRFIASGANTGAVSVEVSSLGQKWIRKKGGTIVLAAGDIQAGMMVEITYDGTVFILGTLGLPITLATPQVSTSGTSIDFTAIPAGVRRITVMFNEVSSSGTSQWRVRLGDAGGFEITGYAGAVDSTAPAANVWDTASGIDLQTANVAAGLYSGVLTLTLLNATTNVWVVSGMLARTDSVVVFRTTGRKATSAVLTQVRITTVGGSDTFDLGEINIAYE